MEKIENKEVNFGDQKIYAVRLKHADRMFRDGVPTVLAAEWDTSTAMFDGESARGPVPRLFATNPAEARGNLASDPARAHKDLQRIMARITINENIPAHAAFELVLNPR